MKPRQIQTFKLLAVAVAAAGCARTELAEPIAAPAPPAQPVQALAPGATAVAETPPAPPPPAPVAPPAQALVHGPPPAAAPDRAAIRALTHELRQLEPAQALQQMEHFRPVCDADGYPLVGNVMTKAIPRPAPEVVAFCTEVRARGAQAKR